jgi:hypothetical protein
MVALLATVSVQALADDFFFDHLGGLRLRNRRTPRPSHNTQRRESEYDGEIQSL